MRISQAIENATYNRNNLKLVSYRKAIRKEELQYQETLLKQWSER
jgi:uncharacterized DUF497 family protein